MLHISLELVPIDNIMTASRPGGKRLPYRHPTLNEPLEIKQMSFDEIRNPLT